MLMEEGRLLREQGKWADAIMTYETVLEIDPTGVKYDYRGGTPRELMEVCVREQTRERMVQVKAEADAGYEKGMELLDQGNELKARKARDVLIQTKRDYAQILDFDPQRSILDEGFYGAIDSRLEELTEVIRDLVRRTLEEDIRSKREQAEKELQAFEADRSDLDRLAGAREALVESLNIIELVDPAGNIVSATQVEQIDARLGEVEEMISEVLPDLVSNAQEQLVALNKAQSVQEGIVKAEAALTILELLDRLRPDPAIQKRLHEVQAVYQNLRRNEDLQRAQQIYEEAQTHYQKALEAFQRNDVTPSLLACARCRRRT
jgi:tetratricopeptide (TPR) repeat protein